MRISYVRSLLPLWILIFFPVLASCKNPSSGAKGPSQVKGLGDILHVKQVTPSAKTIEQLTEFGQILRIKIATQKAHDTIRDHSSKQLTIALISSIIEIGGLPRFQIKETLEDILDPQSNLCAGVPCGVTFGIHPSQSEKYLDNLITDASRIGIKLSFHERQILAASLKHDEIAFTSEFMQESVRKALGIYDRQLTQSDLLRLKNLVITEGKHSPQVLFEGDLAWIPHVTFEIRYRSDVWLETVRKRLKKNQSIAVKIP